MSKLSDYSKFDHLDDDDDSDQEQRRQEAAPAMAAPSLGGVTKKGSVEGRYVFEYNGQKIYEWEQSLEEVNMYVDAPPDIKASQLDCQITPNRLKLGIKNHDTFFIDEETHGRVNTSESSWYLEDDGVINIILIKAHRGETWESALRGQAVDPVTQQEIKKSLMLERFQEENPGMDFRGADFNGEVPDPRTFMGGVKYH